MFQIEEGWDSMAERPDRPVAHTPPKGGTEWHYLDDHLRDVARLASEFATPFGGQQLAHWAGINHDVGKAHKDFQDYLSLCHKRPGKRHPTIDHKMAGTVRSTPKTKTFLQPVIHGHHGGLPDAGKLSNLIEHAGHNDRERIFTTFERLSLMELPPVPESVAMPSWYTGEKLEAEFLQRMIFSCLVDADVLDTERHWTPEASAIRMGELPTLEELWTRYASFTQRRNQSLGRKIRPVNAFRSEIHDHVLDEATKPPGFFRMTVPTGGGKTLTGLAFALRHAMTHRQLRIIVAVPYITITEQTSQTYRDILGEDGAVLEHHSGADREPDDPEGGESTEQVWRRLASENWDAPVVVTTTVQLFESLFSNRTSATRKLHNIANSVILLDEIQTLPARLRRPIFDVLRELVAHYGVTVVLTTATQPVLDTIESDLREPPRELAPDVSRLFQALERVTYDWQSIVNEETWCWERVAGEIRQHEQVLVVVNFVADAADLYTALDDTEAFHLSTRMCGAHRRDKLAEIKQRLDKKQPCRVISTQLIEAGVDIDFPVVYRAIGPLDRIFQAAGRCNREGKLAGKGKVVIFSAQSDDKLVHLEEEYRTGANEARALIREGRIDPNDPTTMEAYFRKVYLLTEPDKAGIQDLRRELLFEQVADRFQMIRQPGVQILVDYQGPGSDGTSDFEDLVVDFRRARASKSRSLKKLFRRAQSRIVTAPLKSLEPSDEELAPGLWLRRNAYDPDRGLVPSRWDPEWSLI